MSVRLIIVIYFILSSNHIFGQNSIKVFGGTNITNCNFHFIHTYDQSDSSGLKLNNYILPTLGADINLSVTNKLNLVTGLGLSWMGSRNYQQNVPDIYKVDPNLRLGYIRIPMVLNLEVFHKTNIIGGYVFNYNFRKNQSFHTLDAYNQLINIYQPVFHSVVVGIEREFGTWVVALNYQKGISRIWDTKDINSDFHAYLTMGGVQITLGYLIQDDDQHME